MTTVFYISQLPKSSKMLKKDILNTDLIQGYKERLKPEVLTKMITLYAQQSSLYFNDIEEALAALPNTQNDSISHLAVNKEEELALIEKYEAWKSACHKMKGAAASIGLLSVYEFAKEMEHMEGGKDEKIAMFFQLKQSNKDCIEAYLQLLHR
jgi:HPt (histidine-containing phosphotransfer) domain-containing protein